MMLTIVMLMSMVVYKADCAATGPKTKKEIEALQKQRIDAIPNIKTFCPSNPEATICKYKTAGDIFMAEHGLMTAEAQKVILELHNSYRKQVANGILTTVDFEGRPSTTATPTGLPKASNMSELVWDEELAASAQMWAMQCTDPKVVGPHDANRATPAYPVSDKFETPSCPVGQNVYTCRMGKDGPLPASQVAINAANGFLKEIIHFKNRASDPTESVKKFSTNPTNVDGHFVQMMWAEATKVGCGIAYYNRGEKSPPKNGQEPMDLIGVTFVCNYDVGKVTGRPIYQ